MSKKDSTVRVLLLLGSVRADRRADAIARWWHAATSRRLAELDSRVDVADLRTMALPLDDEPDEPASGAYRSASTRAWSRLVDQSDAVVVLTSEHNHALPAALKNAFDHLSSEWGAKPVSWVSYGNTSAGTRALLGGKQVATTLGMVPVRPDISIRLADLTDGDLPYDAQRDLAAQAAVTELVRWARASRALRRERLDVPGLAIGYDAHLAVADDAAELLVLQRACWVDEAIANDTLDIAALHESVESVARRIEQRDVILVRHGGRLVAAVQSWPEGRTWHIGRLMAAPDHRRRGVASALLAYAETLAAVSTDRIQLSTGTKSSTNLAFYRSRGYKHLNDIADGGDAATLTKIQLQHPAGAAR